MKQYDKIKITWIDSSSYDDWVDISVALSYEMDELSSVGYFLQEKNDCHYICRTLQRDEGEVSRVEGVMLIPSKCITKIEVLSENRL